MKTIFRLMALLLLVLPLGACSDDDEEIGVPSLEVNNANLHGAWQLTQINESAPAEGSYVYIQFERRNQTFTIYQKVGSMYAQRISGTYTLETDAYGKTTLSGRYDNQLDDNRWNNEYLVTELLTDGTMTWQVKDDATEITRYQKIDAIPQEVIDEARPE